jgi:hypothetical protein
MDAPLCRTCGKRHRLGECPELRGLREAVRAIERGEPKVELKVSAPVKVRREPKVVIRPAAGPPEGWVCPVCERNRRLGRERWRRWKEKGDG